MEFFTQLYLLSWKNFTLRRRHKLRQCIEIFWPLIIFLILVWVRGRKPPEHAHECHFNGKAMPSAGLLPFFQSLMCYSENKCHRFPVTSETAGIVDSFNSSGLSEFYETLQTIVSNETLMMELVSLWNMTQPLPDNFPLSSILTDPEKLRQVQLSPDVMDAIGDADLTPEKFEEILGDQDWRSALCGDTSTLRDLLGIDNDALLRETQHELCDLNMFDMLIVLMKLQGLNNQETYDKILSAINGNADWGDTISSITDGLPLSDLLSDTDAVREFLEQNISLAENVTDLLLNSPLTPEQLQSLVAQDNLRETVCNTTSLGQYLDTDDPDTLDELSDQLCQLSDKQLQEVADELAGHIKNQWNTTDYEALFKELQMRLQVIDDEFKLLEKLTDGLQGFSPNQTMDNIFLGICGNQSDAMEGTIMYGLLGGLRGLDIMNITKEYDHTKDNDMPEEYDKYVKRDEEEQQHEYEYDNTTTPFCNALFQSIESNRFTRIIWTRLKPLMVGYVPYSPNSKAAKRIIEKASWPFKTLQNIIDLSRAWLEYSPELVEFLNRTELPQLPKSFVDSQKNNSWFQDFINVYNETLRDADTWLEAIEVIDQLARTAIDFLQCMNLDRFVGYDTEEDVVKQGLKLMEKNNLWAGIVFSNLDEDPESDVIPKHVHVKIRMSDDVVEDSKKMEDLYWTPGPRSRPTIDMSYLQSGFVYLQDMVEHGIIEAMTGLEKMNVGVYIQQFPYPCYIDDPFLFFLSFVLPMFMVISWVFSVAMTIKCIVYEKERRLKEVMKVMGLGNGVHWVAWFINSFVMMFISSVLLILLIQYGGLLVYSDLSLILFFMMTFCISTMMLCFLISTFFSRANLAAACGGIIFLATYVPYVLVSAWDEEMNVSQKMLVSLINTVAFGYGCTHFAIYEIQGVGLQWNNLATSPLGENSMSFQMALVMMWLDAALYGVLTWYIEAVFPGQYGMPKPWYFPVTKSYWCENSQSKANMNADNPTYEMGNVERAEEIQEEADKINLEAEPSHLPLGVSIHKLVKIYKSGKKLAVDGLSLNFYEDQITSFLGHNGAGKTTTMSILTGLFPPTSGTAYVYGKDILTDINVVRKSMGMCPQHNVLFDHLTVEEHMWFYARLKGMKNKDLKHELEQMIKDVGLPHKRHEKTKNLSGGMKRKLSVAIAFVGGSRVVILDEPTAGVDPHARRSIWDLLSKYRKGRTILLTTHHMDEADILGDRIAIISQGKLKCCGSSLFLKSQFGNGYYLVLVKKSDRNGWKGSDAVIGDGQEDGNQAKDGVDDEGIGSETNSARPSMSSLSKTSSTVSYFDEDLVTTFIQSQVPGATLAESTGTELTYLLPTQATKSGAFERLFTELDRNMQKLSISSYGISDTTLEEIFLKVADDNNEPDSKKEEGISDSGQFPRPFMGLRSLRRKWVEKRQQKYTDKKMLLSDTDAYLSAAAQDESSRQPSTASSASLASSTSPLAASPSDSEHCQLPELKIVDNSLKAKFKRAMATVASPFPSTSQSPNVEAVKYQKKESVPIASEGGVQIASSSPGNSAADTQDPDNYAESDTDLGYEGDLTSDLSGISRVRITGSKRVLRQFQALIIKRFHNSRRNVKAFIAQVLVPVLFVLFMLFCSLLVPPIRQPPSLEMMPWLYPDRQLHMLYSQDSPSSSLSQNLEQNLHYTPGVGTRCMQPQPVIDNLPCLESEATDWMKPELSQMVHDGNPYLNVTDHAPSPSCDCSSGSQKCPAGAGGPPPTYRVTQTSDIMHNLTSRNITDYLVKTNNDYIGMRYTALSFLELNGLAVDPITLARAYNNVSRDLNLTRFNITDDIPTLDRMDEIQKMYSVVLNMATLNNAKVWWNNKGYHALPTNLNLMSNMLLRANIPDDEDPTEYGLTVYNHPMNRTKEQMGYLLFLYSSVDLSIATFTVFALAFVPSSFVVYLIQDRSSNAKHLQLVSGLHSTIYWITHYFWDLCNYCITAFLIIFIFVAFQKEAYVSANNLPCLIALLLLYGWAITPLMYPASYAFTIPSTAYVFLACANVIVGMVTVTATFILDYMDDEEDLIRINGILKKVFLIFPHYCLGRGMLDMATNQLYADAFSQFGEDIFESPFAWDICGRNLFFLGIEGFVFFAVVLFIQSSAFINIRCGKNNVKSKDLDEDEDVYEERQRVMTGNANTDLLRLENLSKVFRTHTGKKNLAVDNLCVGIPAGQCFGLLGVNGAGKTTTFKMLTGDIRPTSGTAYLSDHSILSDMQNVHQNMGYCPQFDALDNLITGREHLEYYARLRGIQEKDIKTVAELGIRKLGLVRYADKRAGDYSGGNKRKLSTAISLIGSPPVVFLDEPTTGMDPKAKRFLWKCITDILKEGRSVVLTSHSMEECEALCSRLAIMVNGRFQCLGSTQHLKNKFGDGYMLVLRIGRNPESDTVDLQPVIEFVSRTFPSAILKERHHNMLEYQLPSTQTSLAHLFGAMEANTDKLLIEDYSVSQTTLDQVFINFAKMQKDLIDDINTDDKEDGLSVSQDANSSGHVVIDSNLVSPSVKYSTDTDLHRHRTDNTAVVSLDACQDDKMDAKVTSEDASITISPIDITVDDYSTVC